MKKLHPTIRLFAIVLSLALLSCSLRAQQVATSEIPDAPAPQQGAAGAGVSSPQTNAPEPRRGILKILPNYRSVSANVQLPPQTLGEKFKMASEDSFSPSTLLVRGMVAGIDQARNATPEFHQGAAGYGRYFWHSYADAAVETLTVEFIMPSVTHEDPRYYRLGSGGFIKRTGYAVRRVLVTRNDEGRNTFNVSEVIGAGAAAGISDLYYPRAERTLSNTTQSWALNVGIDAATFVVREFWTDVNHALFHSHPSDPVKTP